MPPMTDVLEALQANIEALRYAAVHEDAGVACLIVANDLALLHDSLEADHKRQVDALVAEDRLEEMRADALANGSFYNQDEDDGWETGL